MKTEKNILIAFILNLSFAIFEFIGGIFIGSIAIVSDSIHDAGDALGIGISYFLEKKSHRQPDEKYTYGYARYSVLGSVLTTFILLISSLLVIGGSVKRLFSPTDINYGGMIIFAAVGTIINLVAAVATHKGESMNQKAVNLHMLEDCLGWAVVLIGAIIMNFTDITVLDPLMSIGVSLFILVHTLKNAKELIDLFLEKTPSGVDVSELKKHLCQLDGVVGVHHIHVRSLDGQRNYATMHAVVNGSHHEIKERIRDELMHHGICHSTLELEAEGEHCHEAECRLETHRHSHHHHH